MADEKFRVKFGLAVGDNTTQTAMSVDGTSGDITTNGDLAVNGGDIRTTASVASLFPLNAGTVSLATSATTLSIGDNTGTTTVNNALAADSITVSGDAAINGGDITTSATSVTVFDATATTVNAFSAGTIVNIGNATAGQTVGIGTASTANSGYNIGTGVTASGQTKTINIGTGGASGSFNNINIGSATSGSLGTVAINENTTVTGTLGVSGIATVGDNSMVMGNLQATTNSSYTFTPLGLTSLSGNNGLDVASSIPAGSSTLGNGAQQQIAHYFGDTLAGPLTTAVLSLKTATGNSATGGTVPFTGAAQVAASGLLSAYTLGTVNYNGYATTNFTDYISSRNQGGGLNGIHAMQLQSFALENFADGTLTISGATITAISRFSTTLSSVTVSGTRGQISFTGTATAVGTAINVSGTNTGTSTGIVAGTYYVVAATSTTNITLSATPGGSPITTTAGTTTGLTFLRRGVTFTYSAQTNIPFGANALVAVANVTGVTNGTYMAIGTSTTTSLTLGIDTTAVSLPGTQSLSITTVTAGGTGFRIRAFPVATTVNSGNRLDIIDHRASAATYRADTFTFNTGAYGNTGTNLLTIDSSGNTVITGDVRVNGGDIQNPGGTSAITLTSANTATTIKGDTITLEDNAGTDYAVLSANTAKFNVPVTTELTTTTISEGTTYTPAATVDNNISVQINTLAGGTTVIDLINLTGNSRGASYNILVFNNTASGTAIQVKNTRINSNNLMTHTITTGNPRIIINAYVVGDYATATHLVVA